MVVVLFGGSVEPSRCEHLDLAAENAPHHCPTIAMSALAMLRADAAVQRWPQDEASQDSGRCDWRPQAGMALHTAQMTAVVGCKCYGEDLAALCSCTEVPSVTEHGDQVQELTAAMRLCIKQRRMCTCGQDV